MQVHIYVATYTQSPLPPPHTEQIIAEIEMKLKKARKLLNQWSTWHT